MTYTPPIGRRELKKRGLLDENKFYAELAEGCGYIDQDTARRFYMALVKQIAKTLREHEVIRLPHLGDFAILTMKPKKILVGRQQVKAEGVRTLKFYPLEVLKRYFARLSNE